MGRLSNTTFAETVRAATQLGWTFDHATGSHHVYIHAEIPGHLSIPAHTELRAGTLRQLIRRLGITVDEFNRLKR